MKPTKEEREFLLECARVWDRVAKLWDGPKTGATFCGLCYSLYFVSGGRAPSVGRVPSCDQQIHLSTPPRVCAHWFWWAAGGHRPKRAAHARKLAARCRTLAQ